MPIARTHVAARAGEHLDALETRSSTRPRWLGAAAALVHAGFGFVLLPVRFDWLNALPAVAAVLLALGWVALPVVARDSPRLALALQPSAPGVRRPWWRLLVTPFARSIVFLLLLAVAAEFGLRCGSYHRSVYYERQGDLLFTPIPNQEYVEKISLTWSRIDALGLRAGPAVSHPETRRVVLCLGDSITYGYGVDDGHTYPALLQEQLERRWPGQFLVLNAGVNAYPISFEHQKFLYLWNRGVRPDIVIVGYSMNEGWLGHLVDAGPDVKRRFEWQVRLKNLARRSAIYNLVVENWARAYYDTIKSKLVPGTNSLALSESDRDTRYEQSLERLRAALADRHITPLFITFAALDGYTGQFDTDGPIQRRFTAFAKEHGLPVLQTDGMLRSARGGSPDISEFFVDHGHMNPAGTRVLAETLAERLGERGATRRSLGGGGSGSP